jgi:antitoxin (DNA-binding transcriptional repressor) of toxin-antitoxin stability system
MCVNLSNMKTASVRQMQHGLSEVLSWVESGEEVLVYRRKKLVARLVPPTPGPVASPDFLARACGVWGKRPRGKLISELVAEGREEP